MRAILSKLAISALLVQSMPVHAAGKDFALQGYALPADRPVSIVLMRPNVDVGELQAGGLPQPSADWTNAARTNLEKALNANFAERKISFVTMETQIAEAQKRHAALEARCNEARAARAAALAKADAAREAAAKAPVITAKTQASPAQQISTIEVTAPEIPSECSALGKAVNPEELVARYNSLHKAVIDAILIHSYGMGDGKLPTKKDSFAYSLGPGTGELGTIAGGANYGLFMFTTDQFASASRKAMQTVGMLGCLIGACVIVTGGIHVGYVSLVDLNTGNLVWFNLMRGSKGDIREEDGAKGLVNAILTGMPTRPGETMQVAKTTKRR